MSIDIPALIEAAGGEIVGKIRLQKMVYLLDQLGANSDLSFEYHHYGPYSDDLADAVEDDVIFGNIQEEQKRRLSDGVPYVVYRSSSEIDPEKPNVFSASPFKDAIQEMNRQSMTILELAATINWLAFREKVSDWREELVRRKGVKTEGGRTELALDLLKHLKLAPL